MTLPRGLRFCIVYVLIVLTLAHVALLLYAARTGKETSSGLDCTAVEVHSNLSRNVSLSLCYSASRCTGVFTVEIAQCDVNRRALASTKAISLYLQQFGADVLRLRLEGPEVHAVYSQLKRPFRCVYHFTIPRLRLVGEYAVGVEWLYGNFDALDEKVDRWPPLRKWSLLPHSAVRTLSHYHLQQQTAMSPMRLLCENAEKVRETGSVAPCNGMERNGTGRWVKRDGKLFSRIRVRKLSRHPIRFHWELQEDNCYEWVPDECRMERLDGARVAASLGKLRIAVGGDSQLRALYFGIVNIFSGNGVRCVRNVSTIEDPFFCVPNVKGSHRKHIGDLSVDFIDDMFLERFEQRRRYQGYGAVIIGFAQHPASKEHWGYAKYLASVLRKVRLMKELRKRGVTVIWYLAPQYPHTKDGYPVVVRDWRTDLRLLRFNDAARKVVGADGGFPVIDAFAISTAMSHTSTDQAHFSNFVSYELCLMVMNVLCVARDVSCA